MILLLQLSKRFLISLILIFFCLINFSFAEPKDIWKKSKEIKIQENEKKIIKDNNLDKDLPQTVFDKEKIDLSVNKINQSGEIIDDEIIFGLYEPQETKISLNFWSVVDQSTYDRFIKNILKKNKKSLTALSERILFTKTNLSSFPDKGKMHLEFITEWLIKNQKMNLSDKVVKQNKVINNNSQLIKFLFTHYLSNGQIDKACNYINLKNATVQNVELDKFKIFCLLNNKKIKQALSQLELTRETNSLDNFFVEKINFLTGISDRKGAKNFDNVFNAHLTIKVINNEEIKFENFSKSKELRNYFFKSGIANKLLEETMKKSSTDEKNKLNEFREKLILNGLAKIAEPVYFSELNKISNTRKDLVDKNLFKEIEIYNQNKNKNNQEFDNNFIYSSELKKILIKKIDKKDKKKILKLLSNFDKKIKDNTYKLNNKDIALINLLKREKIDLPGSLAKFVYNQKIYIPNEIFNALEKKSNDDALLKTLIFIGNLNEKNDNYTRDILSIVKVFDKIKQNNFKQIFIVNEFSL